VSEAEWAVPGGWTWANFDDVAAIAQDLVSPDKVLTLPHIAPNHIEGATGRLLDYRTVAEDEVISPKQRFFPGQIVFSKIRPYLRKAALMDFEGVCSADMYPLWPSAGVERVYLLRWLLSEDFRDAALAHQGRTLLPKINQAGLRATRIPVPPLPEQRRIVAKLDRLSARTSAARRHLARVAALAARAKQAILAAAFNGDLTADWREESTGDDREAHPTIGLLPPSWRIRRLDEIADIQTGLALGKKRRDGEQLTEQPYLRVANVQRGWLKLEEIKLVGATRAEIEKLTLRDGDILMNEGGDRDKLGRGWVWEGQIDGCLHQNHVFRVRLRDPAFPPRLVSYFANEFGQQFFIDEGQQTTNLASISKGRLSGLPVPMPNASEAQEIVRRIEAAFARIDRLADESARAARLLDRLDERLLARAFRGELVPQDPADEPAAALLARLRQTRAAPPKRGHGRKGVA
jgi:type I restriction enzyme S subunit